jgi:SAM-dependent methyltransferase
MIEDQKTVRARDFGLPDYFDMQAAMGHTKHIGGLYATRELAELCHLGEGQEVLYVGCGSGVSAITLAMDYGCYVVGVDILESMVLAAREWAQLRGAEDRTEFRVADAMYLPFEDDRFDVLICESVNTFVPDLARAASEYARVVKPGGYVGMNEGIWIETPPEAGARLMQELTGQRLRNSEEWVAMLEGVGLLDIEARTHPVDMAREARGQFGFLGCRDILRVMGRFLTQFLFKPSTRELMRLALREPRSAYDYMGYGLYVGRKSQQ